MDPATIATSVLTILTPYVSRVGEELTKTVGEAAVSEASKLLGWLKGKFAGDPVAETTLSHFEQQPKVFEPAVKVAIEAKAKTDPGFAREAEKQVAAIGPTVRIFQKVGQGGSVLAVGGNVTEGQVSIDQDVQKADDVTAVKGNIGR